MFEIKEVIFNNPATIVYWKDGTKTVVKCSENDTWDEEKGLALCFMKKALGNSSSFNDVIHKALDGGYVKEKVNQTKKIEFVIEDFKDLDALFKMLFN